MNKEEIKNMSREEIIEQLEWSDSHEFSYDYAFYALEEIDRLNNIIEELEKYIKIDLKDRLGQYSLDTKYSFGESDIYKDILNKLKELKNGDKDE